MVPKMLEKIEPNDDSNKNLLTFIYSILLLDSPHCPICNQSKVNAHR